MVKEIKTTDRTKLRRLPKRGAFDRETIYKILDEGFVAHVGFNIDEQTFVIPTGYARTGDNLLIHGSQASRMMRAMAWEIQVCATITLIDGLVLARSAFHHSMNYRSVVIFGTAKVIQDKEEKLEALRALTEHIIPNRWQDVRPPNEKEMKATMVLSLPIEEASAKIRTGNPVDDEADYKMEIWAGVIPIESTTKEPIRDLWLRADIETPSYVSNYKRGASRTGNYD
ncbi:MAG: pyridoxamine 5'-phosphate oxidase family protein [Acidobacteriota bacterium]|nr:pyridoxamine 5'-phosphate oxidase family protein [Acidobacteriota bacterium]